MLEAVMGKTMASLCTGNILSCHLQENFFKPPKCPNNQEGGFYRARKQVDSAGTPQASQSQCLLSDVWSLISDVCF